ncbi:hypothetical protein BE08_22505 [Sorangium cellulosum]|uniref:DUF11 domain-containing protein n=1 Tax=Sorangium cellulosum TaxID=56 RepID=A0A150P745_SORCE|nr:hypothetical protein BE08_22505 [Sorangium cellulosum]
MAGLLSLSLSRVSPAAEACGSIFFAPGTSKLDVPSVTQKVRFADMDKNGADDWILIEHRRFTLELRDRDGSPLASATYPGAGGGDVLLQQVEVADVTGDGQLDFIVKHDQGLSVVQQTSGNLTSLGTIDGTLSTPGHIPLLLAAGHFLSRSQADIVVETAAGELRLLHASDGAFRAVATLSDVTVLEKSFIHAAAMPTGDVDGDGLQDLLYPSLGGLAIAQRTASGSFQPGHRLAMDGSYEIGAFGDFDGNGLQDAAVVARRPGASGNDELLLQTWLQAPAGTFTPLEPQKTGSVRGRMLAADLSGDGADELVVGASIGRLVERRWSLTERDPRDDAPEALIDLTGDGVLDLVVEREMARGVRADLAVEALGAPTPIRPGGFIQLPLSLTNRGPSPTRGIALSAESGENGRVALSCGLEDCADLELDAGQSLQFSATVNVGEGEHVDLSVSACSRLFDADTSNNRAALRVPIDNEVRADLSGDVSITIEGSDIALYVNVRSDGPSTARRVRLEQELPEGMVGVTWTSNEDAGCAVQASKLSCELAELAASDFWPITVRGKLDYRGQRVETWVTVRSDTKDPDESNNRFGRVVPEGLLDGILGSSPDGDAATGGGCRLVAPPHGAAPRALWLAIAVAVALGARRARRG